MIWNIFFLSVMFEYKVCFFYMFLDDMMCGIDIDGCL